MWWIGAAMAEDVTLDDFTGPDLSWSAGGGVTFVVPPLPWDGEALACDVGSLGGLCETESGEFVVTHDTVRFHSTADPVSGSDLFALVLSDGSAPVVHAGRPAAGTWDPTELPTDGCALAASVSFSATSPAGALSPPIVYLDDLTLTGAVCPEFVDNDGDGGCLQGTDLDGDGLCIQAGEPALPGVVVDADDAGAADTGTATGDTGTPATTGDTGTPPTTSRTTGDTGTPPATTGDTGTSTSDSGAPPVTITVSEGDSGTAPTTTTDDEPPIHTGQPPVHDPNEDDTGGVIVKGEDCGCGTTGRPGLVGVGLLLVVARVRRRRS